jgi:hypothetical protein
VQDREQTKLRQANARKETLEQGIREDVEREVRSIADDAQI